MFQASIIHQVPGLEVVATIRDDVIGGQNTVDVRRTQARSVRFDANVWIQGLQSEECRFYLGYPHSFGRVEDLPLEIANVYDVVIHDPERTDTSRCKIKGDG
jgi:hypothetical protein